MSSTDNDYIKLITHIFTNGESITTRNSRVSRLRSTPVATFWESPLVSIRKTPWKSALREWQWFMSGSNNIKDLHPSVQSWWKPWASADGCVANNYSEQFRHACGAVSDQLDQIAHLIDGITNHPYSRRNVITTWNAAEMAHPSTPITNCHHSLTQAFVSADNALSLTTYQRSADVICGLPANWIQSWAFLMWLAHRCSRTVGSLTWIGGDVHIYEVHDDLACRMMAAADRCKAVPNLVYTPTSKEFLADDFTLDGEYVPVIDEKAVMVV